jgi:hypothetical protein
LKQLYLSAQPIHLATIPQVDLRVLLFWESQMDESHMDGSRKRMAATPHLDILKRHTDGSYVWLEAAGDLESAKARLTELSALSPGEYFVFDHRAQKVVANSASRSHGNSSK